MMEHTIITIGRQFGSGGHEVGNRLAERLDIPLYDHNLLHMAAQELRISNEDAKKVDETVLGRFLSAYAASSIEYRAFVTSDESGKPLSDKVFEKQSAIIRKLAEQDRAVFSDAAQTMCWVITPTALIHLFTRIKKTVSEES